VARRPQISERCQAPLFSVPVPDTPAFIAGLDDVAVMGEAVEKGGGHLCVGEDGRPFCEGEIGRDQDGCSFVELADQVEQQLPASLCEWQISEFIDDHQIDAAEPVCETAGLSFAQFGFQSIDQVNRTEEPDTGSLVHDVGADRDSEMGFPGTGPANEDGVARLLDK